MQYTIRYDDVAVSTITKQKTITEMVYQTTDINDFNDMCVKIDTALRGRDGLVKVVRPIVEDGALVGISYKYASRENKN